MIAPQQKTVTRWLERAQRGEVESVADILPIVYDELYALAKSQMVRERASHTLSATALVNEAYLRLVDTPLRNFENRAHFFGACARAMRQILIRHAEKRNALKRGGDATRIPLDELVTSYEQKGIDLLALEEALHSLECEDPPSLRLVELRYFIGFTLAEIAELERCSIATLERRWRWVRAWLRSHLEGVS